MPPSDWIDVRALPFDVLLLLEEPHLDWFPRSWPNHELGVALRHHPCVLHALRVRGRGSLDWLADAAAAAPDAPPAEVRRCELAVMAAIVDWLVYVVRPEAYDAQPFLRWDDDLLRRVVDARGRVLVDVGCGTGRLLEPFLAEAATAYAVEPIRHLRAYLRRKFAAYGDRLHVIDGLVTEVPLPAATGDVVLAGHVFGDEPARELDELERVARPGGLVVLWPGSNDVDGEPHRVLAERGYDWTVFEEPGDGRKRGYWRAR